MAEQKKTCCSSPAAMCYWLTVSAVAWAALSLVGIYWHPLHAESTVTILFAMAIGCFANWVRTRTFHCAITGPLFVIAALVFLLTDINTRLVWAVVLIGTGIAFLLEWRQARISLR